ncbi:MAG TPA: peptidase M24 [Lachnospiraceae bacterium]|nr:peptidase M24 [Lachnospiraceae bacterium]
MSAGTGDINNKISSRLSALRLRMETKGVSAVLVPTADPHGSEYIAEHFKVREYLSGFTGSAGSLFVLKDEAFLFTDSRYFIQAEAELKGTGIRLMKMGTQGVPLLSDFIRNKLENDEVLALDGYMISAEFADKLTGIKINTDFDPAAGIWEDRPPLAFSDPYPIDDKYAGESTESKLKRIREEMLLSGCDTHLISSLSDIAWICNLRADDIKHTPVFYSYMIIKNDKAVLFAGPDVLNDTWKKTKDLLRDKGIELLPYSDINEGVTDLLKESESILVNGKELNLKLKQLVLSSGTKITDKPDPSKLYKAVKNPAEINGMKNAHIKDAVAVTQFIIKMKEYGKAVNDPAYDGKALTELSASDMLLDLRKEQEGFSDESFDPIMAFKEHGAIVHYSANKDTDIPIRGNGLLLFDTGAHYKNEGTTDITRTIVIGEATAEEKRHYTLVLRSHLAILNAIFPKGVKGNSIDALAREVLWKEGLDFGHGTGHGVGHLLSVHEGPQSFSTPKTDIKREYVSLVPGMITSDEPGLYFEGKYGIRTESLVECVDLAKAGTRNEPDKKYEGFYGFKPLTLVPFDPDLIDVSLLSDEEIRSVNDYHSLIIRTLSPLLPEQALQSLRKVCRELKQGNPDPQSN